jgi:hypothetical protein
MGRKSKGKEGRKERALERAEVAAQRTPEDQLHRLDRMFGKGQGAAKERLKLQKRIEERNRLADQAKKKLEEKPDKKPHDKLFSMSSDELGEVAVAEVKKKKGKK